MTYIQEPNDAEAHKRRKLLKPDQRNRAYEVLEAKFDRSPQGEIEGWGLKVFP